MGIVQGREVRKWILISDLPSSHKNVESQCFHTFFNIVMGKIGLDLKNFFFPHNLCTSFQISIIWVNFISCRIYYHTFQPLILAGRLVLWIWWYGFFDCAGHRLICWVTLKEIKKKIMLLLVSKEPILKNSGVAFCIGIRLVHQVKR